MQIRYNHPAELLLRESFRHRINAAKRHIRAESLPAAGSKGTPFMNRAAARFSLRSGRAASKGGAFPESFRIARAPSSTSSPRAQLVRRDERKSSPNFVQLVLVPYQFCTNAQLFPPPLRATLERKLNYEASHTITAFWAAPEPAGAHRGRISVLECRLSACNLCIINR